MIQYISKPFKWFLKLEAASGLVLLFAAAIALIISNSDLSTYYEDILNTYFGIGIGNFKINLSVLHWVNDVPMGSNGPDRYVTGMMFNWNLLYKHIVDQLAAGKLKMNQRYNWGLKENCVGLSPWGKNVPGNVVNKVETIKMDWINDNMDEWYPFSQGITKQDGSKVSAGVIKRPELETMQYFVKGVTNKFPTN